MKNIENASIEAQQRRLVQTKAKRNTNIRTEMCAEKNDKVS